ncbi:pirin family protein [Compostimonas suwonensis]|uniref:Pirin family protein n=1 Tax=Compostimonas suwonensis TaxID=1048394 RepID=A0A2M9C535_9MICO|nr:pirin family protein [Compostimonas suwonensis]PJJ65609.1 hypothetical protein CLV54_0645 [Compostimonas suwonensis]
MSNLEKRPAETVVRAAAQTDAATGVEILFPRDVPLGGPRAMSVRRTLPQRARSTIGAWCFIDHYGPDPVDHAGAMQVPPHPHTGLQTVSWLFAGEIEHRDSVGSHAMVRPGELNLMTAGRGISHSEVSTAATTSLHGAQLWVALPDGARDHEPFFEHHVPQPVWFEGATVRVIVGTLLGVGSAASAFTPLVGAQIDLPAGARIELPVDASFEHGVLADTGRVRVEGTWAEPSQLAYVDTGRSVLRLEAETDAPARVLLVGGVPFGEQIVMWWNFIGRSHEEVVEFRRQWQAEVIAGEDPHGRFGAIPSYDGSALPAPELPTVRLKPRA